MPRNTSRAPAAARAFLICASLSGIVFSCELSSGFLSDSERSSLYELNLGGADGSSLQNGAVLFPGTGITALVAKKTGAADLASMDFSLLDSNGASAVALHLFTSEAPSAASNIILTSSAAASMGVPAIDGKLTGFKVPEGIAAGYYVLSVSIAGTDGSTLQKTSLSFFVDRSRPVIESVSTFPPSVEPGASVLLGVAVSWLPIAAPITVATVGSSAAPVQSAPADVSGAPTPGPIVVLPPAQTRDPWIRWSKDGHSFAEGSLSSGLDKVVWPAPRIEGAYAITVELFPTAPSSNGTFPFKSLISQDLKVMVIATPGGSGNDFADPLEFYSLLRLNGNFDDTGTRPRSVQPESFGSPSLETYSDGFGYRFGPASGIRIPGLMPPAAADKLGAFSTVLRLYSDQSDGVLARFTSNDGSYALVLGIENSLLYFESQISGFAQRSTAVSPIPRFPMTIEANFIPVGDKLTIEWVAEGERIASSLLPLPPAPPDGWAQLGGGKSISGVFDGFGLVTGHPLPAYRLAARRKWKTSLILAEAFEDSALPPQSVVSGDFSLSSGALHLEPGASLALSPNFGLSSALDLEADIEGDSATCALVLSVPGGEHLLSVNGMGIVSDTTGARVGYLPVEDGRIALTLEAKSGKLYLRAGDDTVIVDLPGSARLLSLSLEREGGKDSAAFDRVLVRSIFSSSIPK